MSRVHWANSAATLVLAPVLALVSVVPLGLHGCKGGAQLQTPDAVGADPGSGPDAEVPAAAGTVFRYEARARSLRQTGHLEMVQRGAGQYAEASLDVSANVDMAPLQDRLKVVWTIDGVEELALQGALQTSASADEPKAFLLEFGKGAYLSDLRGQAEDDPTLPENTEREAKLSAMRDELEAAAAAKGPTPVAPGLQLLSYLPPMLQLPSLPEAPLPMGEAVVVEREEETELGDTGVLLPFDVEMAYTLVSIDSSGGARIAEMSFEGSAIGATEGPGGEVVVESRQRGTLLFNLDAQVPVSYESLRTETIEMGQFSAETETTIRSSWEESSGPDER